MMFKTFDFMTLITVVNLYINASVNSSCAQPPPPPPPPPWANAWHLPALSVPGMGHLQILLCPGTGYLPSNFHFAKIFGNFNREINESFHPSGNSPRPVKVVHPAEVYVPLNFDLKCFISCSGHNRVPLSE